jgi:hypothetical protein
MTDNNIKDKKSVSIQDCWTHFAMYDCDCPACRPENYIEILNIKE